MTKTATGTAASFAVRPLHPLFAAEVSGARFDEAPEPSFVAEARAVADRYGVAVFRNDAPISDEAHLAFSRRLGPVMRMKMLTMIGRSKTRLRYPELIDVGNLDTDGRILADDDRRRKFNRGNRLWHVDVSFDPVRATYSLLSAHVVPPVGADTEFADMRAAYEALPAAMKARIEGLEAEHSVWYSRALAGLDDISEAEKATRPPARHQLVHVNPGSGRKSVYLASHASHVVGWPIDEGRDLLRELTAFATQPRFVYRHEWRRGDLVMWDNLSVMHRGTPFDDTRHPRDMRRTTVLETA